MVANLDIETKTAEMKFTRRTAGYNLLGHRRNGDVLEELNVNPVEKKSAQYKQKLLNHISGTEGIRYPKQLLDYRNVGRRRRFERPLTRLLDAYSREDEAGHLLAVDSLTVRTLGGRVRILIGTWMYAYVKVLLCTKMLVVDWVHCISSGCQMRIKHW
jgi:hypothetical protein